MRKILVLRGGALGDFVVTLPALSSLRQRWPAARIELAGNATAAQLARARGLLDAVHSQHEARWSALFGDAPLPADFATWLAEFDLVLNFWPDPDGALQRRFPLHDGQTFLNGAAMPSRAPAAAHYCEPLRALGIEAKEFWYPLEPLTAAAPRGSSGPVPRLPRRTTLIHPGSGSARKNWPKENWLALVRHLPTGATLVLGEAELRAWSGAAPRTVDLLISPPFEELVARFSRCRLFLGHDSGISHLAAACGARCLLLFGPTDPVMWAPPTPKIHVLRRGPELSALSLVDVRSAVAAALADQT